METILLFYVSDQLILITVTSFAHQYANVKRCDVIFGQ